MKLDKEICLGGHYNDRDVSGIKFNGYYIYGWQPNYKGEYGHNIYTITITEENTTVTLEDYNSNCVNTIEHYTNWGDGIKNSKTNHVYKAIGTYTITTTLFIKYDNAAIKLIDSVQDMRTDIKEGACLFLDATNMNSFNMSGCNNLISTFKMFSNCTSLTSVTLPDAIISTSYMSFENTFLNCSSLTSLDLSSLNFVRTDSSPHELFINAIATFAGCRSLKTLDISNWANYRMGSLRETFRGCSSLESIDVSNWDTSATSSMYYTFCGCSSLKTLDLTNWSTAYFESNSSAVNTNKYNAEGMFAGCSSLETIIFGPEFTMKGNASMQDMFRNCESLKTLDLSGWNTSECVTTAEMFYGCNNLEELDLSGWDTKNIAGINALYPQAPGFVGMFNYCTSLKKLILNGCNVDTVRDLINPYSKLPTTDTINGEKRKIYCSSSVASQLTEPQGWEFVTN